MRNFVKLSIVLSTIVTQACSSKSNEADDDTGYTTPTGGAKSYSTPTGGANSSIGGAGAANNTGVSTSITNTGGAAAAGGRAAGGNASVGTGGSTASGTAACSSGMCGQIVDFLGAAIDCGTCPTGSVCGLTTDTANQCTACTVSTCAAAGAECGYLGDGCGGLLDCGKCTAPEQCGVATANKCDNPDPGALSGDPCSDPTTGFCPQVADCSAAATDTTVTGTVLAPNGTMPLPNALVYVPNGATASPYGVQPFVDGVANGACECNISGTPLVSTTSGVDGSFTLTGVPVGKDIPLVIQLGRWRRLITISQVSTCSVNPLPRTQTSLPSRQNMGSSVDSIPLMALATGAVDAMECVLRKMGIEDTQFSNPWDNGRIRFYRDNGAHCDSVGSCTHTTPSISELTSLQGNVDQYDAVIFPCKGAAHDVAAADKNRVLDAATSTSAYVNKGGRAFFTHFSYGWLYNQQPSINLPWRSTTDVQAVDNPSGTTHHDGVALAEVDTSFARGQTFATWLGLNAVNALSSVSPPEIGVSESRWDLNDLATWDNSGPAQRWAYYPNMTQKDPDGSTYNQRAMMHVTFDTPWAYPPAQQCGRVLYSDFHVTNAAIASQPCIAAGTTSTASPQTSACNFPDECNTDFSAQEKTLAYFMFDMTSCVRPPALTCKPKTCADMPTACGPQGDGCGGLLDCGPCCVPKTCDQRCAEDSTLNCSAVKSDVYAVECPVTDGCSKTVNCYCMIG